MNPHRKPLSVRTRLMAGALVLAAAAPALALKVGDAAPAFDLPAKSGGTLSLAGLRGQYVYVDFWASWCGPCKQSFPWMNTLQAKYSAQGLKVVAINVDEQAADANRFLAEAPANFAIAFDSRGATPGTWGVQGMPTSFLVGPDGKVLFVHQSFKAGEAGEVEAKIASLLQGRAASGSGQP